MLSLWSLVVVKFDCYVIQFQAIHSTSSALKLYVLDIRTASYDFIYIHRPSTAIDLSRMVNHSVSHCHVP